MPTSLAIASDHAGFALKEQLKKHLIAQGYAVRDFGPHAFDPADDYPDFVIPMARAVSRGRGEVGIAVCGTGDGACIAANKVKGVRASFANTPGIAYSSRHHNNANVLCLGGGKTKDATTRGLGLSLPLAKKIVHVWLTTPFSGAARHKRRLKKIARIEK